MGFSGGGGTTLGAGGAFFCGSAGTSVTFLGGGGAGWASIWRGDSGGVTCLGGVVSAGVALDAGGVVLLCGSTCTAWGAGGGVATGGCGAAGSGFTAVNRYPFCLSQSIATLI